MKPRITIITPSFQQGIFLEDALQSVLAQEDPETEHWIVDGGSTDGSVAILQRYAERHPGRIRWISEPDAGQTDAINKGLDRAAGDIIGWLNADDLYFPGAVAAIRSALAEQPEADVVYGQSVFLDRDGNYLCDFPHTAPFDAARLLAGHAFLLQPSVFWRRAVTKRIGRLDPALHYSMDYDLWCRMARAGSRFHYLPDDYVAAARYYPGTKTLSGAWRRSRELAGVARRHSRRALPAITLFSFLDALMTSAPAPVRRPLRWLYRRRKQWSEGLPLDYGEIRPPWVEGSFSFRFPCYRETAGLEAIVEVQGTPAAGGHFVMTVNQHQDPVEFPITPGRQTLRVPDPVRGHEVHIRLATRPCACTFRLVSVRMLTASS